MPAWLIEVLIKAAENVIRETFVHHGILPPSTGA